MPHAGSFLQRSRHRTTYYFRRRVPDDLQAILCRKQLYRTLHTAEWRIAVAEARKLLVHTDSLFAALRDMVKSRKGKGEPLPKYQDWGAFGSDPRRSLPSKAKKSETAKPARQPGSNPQAETEVGDSLRLDYIATFHESGALASIQVAPGDEADHRRALELVAATKQGNAAAAQPTATRQISACVEEWLRHVGQTKAHSTWKEYSRHASSYLLPFFDGSLDVSTLNQARFAAFAKWLHEEHSRLAASSRNHILSAVVAFSGWLHSEGVLAAPFTSKNSLATIKTAASKERGSFDLHDFQVILGEISALKVLEPSKYWVTVASALLGTRLEELAQIEIRSDLVHDGGSGTWGISVNCRPDEDGVVRKALKRKSSERIVPIHPALVKLGFVDFLKSQLARGHERPFVDVWRPLMQQSPKLGAPADGIPKWSQAISKWGGQQLGRLVKKRLLLKGNRTYFHSMRHTVTQQLYLSNVQEQFITAYIGHADDRAPESRTRYGALNDKYVEVASAVEPGLQGIAAVLLGLPSPSLRAGPEPTQQKRPRGRPPKRMGTSTYSKDSML